MYKSAITLMALLLAGCSATGTGSGSDDRVEAELAQLGVARANVVNSVANFRISGWRSIDNRHLIVTAGLHDHYLVSLATPCLDLDFAFSIALDTRTSALSRGDDVVVNSLHRPRERCQITEITRLVDTESADE